MNATALEASVKPAASVDNPNVSLARRRRARALGEQHAKDAAKAPAAEAPQPGNPGASEYELQKARLGVDLRRLSEIQSVERKIALKHDLLPAYREWVDGVLAADSGPDDVILAYCMIWAIDVGDYGAALPMIEYVLRHDLPLPERFDRTAPTLIVEEIAEAALRLMGTAKLDKIDADKLAPFETAPPILGYIVDLAGTHDMPDPVKAKAHKALGLMTQRSGLLLDADADGPAGTKRALYEVALAHFRRAFELDEKIGVKKRIEQLDKEVAHLAAEQGGE